MKMQEQLIDTAMGLRKEGMGALELEDRIPGSMKYFQSLGGSTGAPQATSNPNLSSGPARPEPAPAGTVPMGTPPVRAPGEESDFHGTTTQPVATTVPVPAPAPAAALTPPAAPAAVDDASKLIIRNPVVVPTATATTKDPYDPVANTYTDPFTHHVTTFSGSSPSQIRATLDVLRKQTSEMAAKRHEKNEKEVEGRRAAITSFTPETTSTNETDLIDLARIIKRSPKIMDIMRNDNGIRSIVNTALAEGISFGALGRLNFPVKPLLIAGLDDDERSDYQRARMIMAKQFFASAMADHAAIPGTISNLEEGLLKAPTLNDDDTVKTANRYIQRALVLNEQRKEQFKGFMDYKYKYPNASFDSYFDPTNKKSPYYQINDTFAKSYADVVGRQ
jgi:hypothetical protein